ncbi:hypothetical protein GGQ00_003082 [Salinibacter ruber]|nr:hypothetical protein [Salinibacter ruber]
MMRTSRSDHLRWDGGQRTADGRFLSFRTECHVLGMPIESTDNVRSDE